MHPFWILVLVSFSFLLGLILGHYLDKDKDNFKPSSNETFEEDADWDYIDFWD